MAHTNRDVVKLLRAIDLGSSVAEQDGLLENARIDTSAFTDLIDDKVDLIPGSKGSGKTALYRIIVDFMSEFMLAQKRIVVAHGVRHHGDQVFQVFRDRFGKLSEEDFVSFWCVYFVSLANEHFIKAPEFESRLAQAKEQVDRFRSACRAARIPSFEGQRTLREVLDWALDAVLVFLPKRVKISHTPSGTEAEVDLFGRALEKPKSEHTPHTPLPIYVEQIKDHLEAVLEKCDLHLWLMIDRLDEIFPRRSALETKALRGLLRVLRIFDSPRIRIKIFLRDDILDQVVEKKGFTALTHVSARRAKPLAWTEEQILCLLVRRLYAQKMIARQFEVDPEQLALVPYARAFFIRL